MFDFSNREKLLLAAAVIAAIALGVWAAVIAANYITSNSNDPLAKAGGLDPVQRRDARTKL